MANAYESVTVMLISIFQGKGVNTNTSYAVDEHDNIALGFSRDGEPTRPKSFAVEYRTILGLNFIIAGFHFTRTVPLPGQMYRTPFIAEACPHWTAATAKSDPNCSNSSRWNFVNVQPTGGGFLTFRDEIRFYVSGRRPSMSAHYVDGHGQIAAGIARLRRDSHGQSKAIPSHHLGID